MFPTKINLLYLLYWTDDSAVYLPVSTSRTNLKLHNIYVTPKAFGAGRIPVEVLKNFRSALSSIQTELFNLRLKESCFPDHWKVSSVVPVFKNVGEKVYN